MNIILILLLFSHYFVVNSNAAKTLYGNNDVKQDKFVINTQNFENSDFGGSERFKRAADGDIKSSQTSNNSIDPKGPEITVNYLNDTHKQLMVHWVGEKSNVLICLARDPSPTLEFATPVSPSAVYISYDYGTTYQNKTSMFKLSNGSLSTLEKFYNHPKYNTRFVFTDIRHNAIFVTKNHGEDFKRFDVDFTPSDVSFHEYKPATFLVLDKNNTANQKLYLTQNFGESYRLIQEFVKTFYWVKVGGDEKKLVIQRSSENGVSHVIYSDTFLQDRSFQIFDTFVKDVYFKGDYIFVTKTNEKGALELYVSYKFGKSLQCIFDTNQVAKGFMIVDVTGTRALVAVSHSETSSTLYVSENLGGSEDLVKFTVSLPDVFCYFPEQTWHNTWLRVMAEDAFADVYKVEGLSGIYIASRVISKPTGTNLGPSHLGSVITFDHGSTWRLIEPPAYDVENQSTACAVTNNCSLHLSQKFSQLNPETRTISILSSKSNPGVIVATGVIGNSLKGKGHYGVYVSVDAGVTWKQSLRDLYFFNMGDYGSIFTAVKYYRSKGETRHILYSMNEGESWRQTQFHNKEIRFYGLMTEPGENSTVFTMFGSFPDFHQWMIIKIDFKNIYKTNCTDADYKFWSPSQSGESRSYIPCVLGEQTTYQRRLRNVDCMIGLDHQPFYSRQPCDCDILDFECDFGFMKTGTPPRCIRDKNVGYDPYKVPDNCKQGKFYNRTKGYRKIASDHCVNGFEQHYLPDLVPCPFNEADDFLLFARRDKISRFNLVTNLLEELPIANMKNVIAIDFDMKNNCLYWADISLDTIGRQCLTNGTTSEILVTTDLASIEGMALDWISNTLYFVDGVRSKIELIRTDINHSGRMRRTILDSRVLKKPRGIALHPPAGYMFWTDWSIENPSVNRANLDGSNTKILFGRDKVEWPNGITIDYIANRVYWVDARKDYIGSSDLHGDGFLKVVSNDDVVSHPFAVAVFKNNMYWDDWKRNAIFTADKDTVRGVETLVPQLNGLMDLKVYAHGIQIGSNACSNHTCDFICVGLPKNNYTCLCPDGFDMKNGKCMCPGNVVPLENKTCPKVQNTCSVNYFTCKSGTCVPKGWRCDGEDDCGDNSDEALCDEVTCPPTFFQCNDGKKCLPHYWKCDYDDDCADKSDELNCPKQVCLDHQFTCANGRCITAQWKCDGENDCRDGSDEINCLDDRPTTCKADEFTCGGGQIMCIPISWQCDNENDCRNGNDEANCTNRVCSDNEFSCGAPSNRCIHITYRCDGDADCPNGKDEENCPTLPPTSFKPSDLIPTNRTFCQNWMFRCNNNRCIPNWWKCDQADDCGDGSDEVGCNNPDFSPDLTTPANIPQVCHSNMFQCAPQHCIYSAWVCDGEWDCPNGEDERNCTIDVTCDKKFKCRTDGSCIHPTLVCDGKVDCPDMSDEQLCNISITDVPATPSCSLGWFPCDGGTCYPLALLCDNKIDCKDGYDEANCTKTSRIYQVRDLGIDGSRSNETSMLFYWWTPTPTNLTLEFLPSISILGSNVWENKTWTSDAVYVFTGLQPFTTYNMTVYVRINGTKVVFPPAKFYTYTTAEGVPSEPFNVVVKQKNASTVLISWHQPIHPNGTITNYKICYKPPDSQEIQLKLNGNETSHLLPSYFQHNTTYVFYVIAMTKDHESKRSEPAKITFDMDVDLDMVLDLTSTIKNDSLVTLTWKYTKKVDGFTVHVLASPAFPRIEPYKTVNTTITIMLAPATSYHIEVNAYKGQFVGPIAYLSVQTSGIALPDITSFSGIAAKDSPSVKLSWARPNDPRKITWRYGIFYGIREEELIEKPRLETTNQTVTIHNLDSCELYFFAIAITGPYGVGPLSYNRITIGIRSSDRAPPKKVSVVEDEKNPLKMILSWLPPCSPSLLSTNLSYVIRFHETVTNKVFNKILPNNVRSHSFDVHCGGIYNITISTNDTDAIQSKPVIYYAPPVLPPYEVRLITDSNGSYIVFWQERELPHSGTVQYEVVVSEGNHLNESISQRFRVTHPPLIFNADKSDDGNGSKVYTFAVRTLTDRGFKSVLSEQLSRKIESLQAELKDDTKVYLPAVLVPTILILLAMGGVIVFLIVRNRRLHNSFARFTNSHYDTRSGAATFDDNGLEEDDSPQIHGFSDDEPLVIA